MTTHGRPDKVGRLADAAERKRAQGIVDLYRLVRDNPAAAPDWTQDEQIRRVMLRPEYLLQVLECFALNGTFGSTTDNRHHFAAWIAERCGSSRYEDRLQAVMDEMHVSERTAARLLTKK